MLHMATINQLSNSIMIIVADLCSYMDLFDSSSRTARKCLEWPVIVKSILTKIQEETEKKHLSRPIGATLQLTESVEQSLQQKKCFTCTLSDCRHWLRMAFCFCSPSRFRCILHDYSLWELPITLFLVTLMCAGDTWCSKQTIKFRRNLWNAIC